LLVDKEPVTDGNFELRTLARQCHGHVTTFHGNIDPASMNGKHTTNLVYLIIGFRELRREVLSPAQAV
jgi:hypothetical protein